MTRAKNKADWIKAWKTEINHLTRVYQCKADPVLFDQLRFSLNTLITIAETIGERMEEEGVWDKSSFLNVQRGYREARNRGYTGSLVEYCNSIGLTVEDLKE